MPKDTHVVPSTSGGWSVRRAGAEKSTVTYSTQTEAVRHAKSVARNESAELYIHNRDGTIKERKSYSSGPLPQKK
jgi:hypothetical protein